MFFHRKRPDAVSSPASSSTPRELTAEESLVQALQRYRQQFEHSLERLPDQHTEDAKAVLAKARKIIGETGLGPALAPTLIEEVMYWHGWISRPDFLQWVNFPASAISAEQSKDEKNHTITRVVFTYNNSAYTVVFTDNGYNSFVPESDQYTGKAETRSTIR